MMQTTAIVSNLRDFVSMGRKTNKDRSRIGTTEYAIILLLAFFIIVGSTLVTQTLQRIRKHHQTKQETMEAPHS